MANPEWFRNTNWSSAIERDFFARLSRARSQRDQYLSLQAAALVERHPEVTLRLCEIYFESRKDNFEDTRVLSAKAAAFLNLNDLDSALKSYRAILDHERTHRGIKTNAYLEYPYLVATQLVKEEYAFALSVLDEHQDQLAFPLGRFKWNAAYALILFSAGQVERARAFATKAIEAANETQSEFRYHRELGLVGELHDETISKILRIGA